MRTTLVLVAVFLCCRCSALPTKGSSAGSMASSGTGAGMNMGGGSGMGIGGGAGAGRMTGVSSSLTSPVVTQASSSATSASSANVNNVLPVQSSSYSSASATTSGFTNGGGFSNSGSNVGLGQGILNGLQDSGAGLSSGLIGVGGGHSDEQCDSGGEQVVRRVVVNQGSGYQGDDSYGGDNKHGKNHVVDLSNFAKNHRQVCIPELLAIALLARSELGNGLKDFLSLLPYFHLGGHKQQELTYLSDISRLLVDRDNCGTSDHASHFSHLGDSGSGGRVISVASLLPSHLVSGTGWGSVGKMSNLMPHLSSGQGKILSFLPHLGGGLGGISGGSGGLSHMAGIGSLGGILRH